MSKHHIYYVYILKCSDNSYYTGVTNNLHRRVQEHQEGTNRSSYTYKRRPVQLVFYTEFSNVQKAIEIEKIIKSWSRAKKEALINEEYEKLPGLSKKDFRGWKLLVLDTFPKHASVPLESDSYRIRVAMDAIARNRYIENGLEY